MKRIDVRRFARKGGWEDLDEDSKLDLVEAAMAEAEGDAHDRYYEAAARMFCDEVAPLIKVRDIRKYESIASKYLTILAALSGGAAVPANAGRKSIDGSRSRGPGEEAFEQIQKVFDTYDSETETLRKLYVCLL